MSTSSKGIDAQGLEHATCDSSDPGDTEVSTAKRKRPPSPHNCRNFIRRQTANAMPAIVNMFVDRAKEGSVAHFTSLAKVGGFDQRQGADEAPKRRRKSLARQLLDEVERYEAQQAAELAAAEVTVVEDAAAAQIDSPVGQERS